MVTFDEMVNSFDNYVKVITKNEVLIGYCETYTSVADNEPDPASICLRMTSGLYEIFQPNIKKIIILDEKNFLKEKKEIEEMDPKEQHKRRYYY